MNFFSCGNMNCLPTVCLCLLAYVLCPKNFAVAVKKANIDFSQLEFENLQSETSRDEFVKNLESYELAYPIALEVNYKLSEKNKRLRRDVTDSRMSHYQIAAFGKIVEIELQNSENILPGAAVEYHKTDGIQKKLLSENNCFKVGKVVNTNGTSSVAISDCDGLAGLIKTADDLFFIEPMKSTSAVKSSLQRPHLVYRTKDMPLYSFADYVDRTAMDQVLKAPNPAADFTSGNRSSRVRRDVWDSFVTFVNKAGRSLELHWLDLFGRRRYFVTLGPNQRRSISTYANTKWIAIDGRTQQKMKLNGNLQFVADRNSQSNRVTVTITAPADLGRSPVTSNKLMGREHWIEALIVADETIVRFHGKDKVEKYLLVLSNMISLIMKDPSIGVRLNFVLTRLVILQRKEAKLTIYTKNPSKSVRSACQYAASIQKSNDDGHAEHHDFALIFTKHRFGPAGYAPVYTMCTKKSSCALVDDSGFASAFIAAHEAGHTLGLGHDGEENKCKDDTNKGSVMAPLVVSKLTKFHWSKCSRKTIQENIEYFECLRDRPQKNRFKYQDRLPGAHATVDEQCRFVFGPRYQKCTYYGQGSCTRLWCTEANGQLFSCTTRRRPPLDGTYCDTDKWCVKGKCVPSDIPSTRQTPVNGKWGDWGKWSKCSLSCGIGVRIRSRKCDNPKPAHGGKSCEGKTTEREICNAQKCDITKRFSDVRSEQCEIFAGDAFTLYKDSMFTNRYKDSRYSLDCTFQDGFCNWVQERNDKFDWKVHKGRTPSAETGPKKDHNGNSNGKYVFIEASDNIGARRRMGDTARLASPGIILPRSCLRFHYHMYGTHMGTLKVLVQKKGEKDKVVWKKSGNQGNLWFKADVSIKSAKPYRIILEAVRGAHYTSDISIDSLVFTTGLCDKEATAKNPCTVSCVSENKREFVLDKTVLDGTRCYNNKSHDICIDGQCKVYGCDNKFGSTKVLDDCNVCGGDGSSCNAVEGTKDIVPRRDYETVLDVSKDTTNFVLEESKSSPYRIGLRVPGSVNEIYMAAKRGHGYHKIAGATLYFTNLEDGRQMISANGPFDKNLEAVLYAGGVSSWKRKKAQLTFKFFEKKDDRKNYKYEVDQWEPCSKSCDSGSQKAIFKCVKNKKTVVDLRYCSHLEKKELVRACNEEDCRSLYKWVLLPWSQCSAKCGSGRRRRVVACVIAKINKVVPNSICPPPYPTNWQYCNTNPCFEYVWSPEPWGTCSKSCGGGLQSREITCMEKVSKRKASKSLCTKAAPVKVQECNLQECDSFRYKTAAVGKCSKSCGGGLRVKIVNCVNKRTGGRVGNLFCTGPPPPRIEKCNTDPCPYYEWTTGKFGACSQTCDGGERRRRVYCHEKVSQKEVTDGYCADDKRPSDTEYCDNPPCSSYHWHEGPWSKCNALCGVGTQNRSVRCLMEGTRAVSPDSRCSRLFKKPRTTRSCQVRECASEDSLACNFDDNHFCNWNNEPGDDFDWGLGKNTPTLTTGPDRDHTTKKGIFAYIETSSPRLSRDRAFLSSPLISLKGGCFTFWYHMKGSGMGRLFVFLVDEAKYKKRLFFRERHQGDRWKRANVRIPKDAPNGYRILIVGQRGSSFLSDIALDDLRYTENECPASCIERSPLCVVVPMEQYCHFPAFKKLCCETCAKVR